MNSSSDSVAVITSVEVSNLVVARIFKTLLVVKFEEYQR